MSKVWIKRSAVFLVVIGLALGFYWALREQPILVDTIAVVDGPMRVTIREEGVARVRDVYTVSAPIAGHLSRIALDEGDRVEGGATVIGHLFPLIPALIDRRTQAELMASRDAARSAVIVAESELLRVQAALKLAESDLRRSLKLIERGIISETSLEKSTSQVELLKAEVDAAKATVAYRRAELTNAEARLMPSTARREEGECCVELRAPVDGEVLTILVESEQAVAAGAPIAEIGNTSDLEIVVDLLTTDAVKIAPGSKALIKDWGGGRSLPATVKRIDPAAFMKVSALGIEEQRVKVRLSLDERDDRISHQYRVYVEVALWECARCLQVPLSALFRNGNNWNIFVVEQSRAKQRKVDIGHMNDQTAEVLGGIGAKDMVITHPSDILVDGASVEERKTAQ